MTSHDCEKHFRVYMATRNKPYHFVDSGLPNVYLIGVRYRVCRKCGAQSADIPSPVQLMNVIAEAVVMRPGVLCGAEIRFLRKRARKKASDFAALINNTPQHLSKLENGALPLQEATDKLIRLTYGLLCGNARLSVKSPQEAEQWFRSIHGKKIHAIHIKNEKHGWMHVAA